MAGLLVAALVFGAGVVSTAPPVVGNYVGYDLSPNIYNDQRLVGHLADSNTPYHHGNYPSYTKIPFYGKSKTSHGDILGKINGGVIKGKYWSRKFAGGLRKRYGGSVLSGQYTGSKGLYKGQFVGKTHGGHLYRGIYRTYTKITYLRGTLKPSRAKQRSSIGLAKQTWPPRKLHSRIHTQILPLKRTYYYSALPTRRSNIQISPLPWPIRRSYPHFSQSARPIQRHHAQLRKSALPIHGSSSRFYGLNSRFTKPNLLPKHPQNAILKPTRLNRERVTSRLYKQFYRQKKNKQHYKYNQSPRKKRPLKKPPVPVFALNRRRKPIQRPTVATYRRLKLIKKASRPRHRPKIVMSLKKCRELNKNGKKCKIVRKRITASSRKRKFIRRFIRKLKKTRQQYRKNIDGRAVLI